jgi:hypothetical protein
VARLARKMVHEKRGAGSCAKMANHRRSLGLWPATLDLMGRMEGAREGTGSASLPGPHDAGVCGGPPPDGHVPFVHRGRRMFARSTTGRDARDAIGARHGHRRRPEARARGRFWGRKSLGDSRWRLDRWYAVPRSCGMRPGTSIEGDVSWPGHRRPWPEPGKADTYTVCQKLETIRVGGWVQ